ncbi:Hcp family type VI secretion system effector [Trinickia mobilis]|uniref:Hcp family type VI secretion system effector n=1 Tax=Trinickia mobilis TaxID=2816356 RepID=UPI001A8DF021|nr:type VI secretion system tube protein Hcp [Trinickia mobilis]
MAVDMFVKFTPEIKGESQDSKHAGEIDVLAWSWGLSQSGTMHMGTGGGAGKASVQDMSFTKYTDKASPPLIGACTKGSHFDKVEFTCRKAGGTEPLEYYIMTLEGVLISSYSTGGSGGEERFTENLTLNFEKFRIDYQPQNAKGAKEGGVVDVKWNIVKNAET